MENKFEHIRKTEEIISRFKNGNQLYLKSAVFNRMVQMLARGMTEYEVMQEMVMLIEDNIKASEYILTTSVHPVSVMMPHKH